METRVLAENAAAQKAREQFVLDVRFIQHLMRSPEDNFIELPNAYFAVPIRVDDVAAEPLNSEALDELHEVLARRAAKYAAARLASIITLRTGATAVVWSGEPVLVPVVDYVVLSSAALDPSDSVYVQWEYLIKELPDVAEKIRRRPPQYYFGAVASDGLRWANLAKAGKPIDELSRQAG
jgi:hypothetical protein